MSCDLSACARNQGGERMKGHLAYTGDYHYLHCNCARGDITWVGLV